MNVTWRPLLTTYLKEVWPLPKDVKEAVDNYLRLDRKRREV